jgi:hypothetical protein
LFAHAALDVAALAVDLVQRLGTLGGVRQVIGLQAFNA